jgi:hypothetical protein
MLRRWHISGGHMLRKPVNLINTGYLICTRLWMSYSSSCVPCHDMELESLRMNKIFQSAIFSAIITPFLAESYKLLDQQPSPAFFGRGGYSVRVNAMWFGSLILSLIAGLFSIHCKMWLDGSGVSIRSLFRVIVLVLII